MNAEAEDVLQVLKGEDWDLHYRLLNASGWVAACYQRLKPDLIAWASSHSCAAAVPVQLFNATWEAITNAIYYGAEAGEALHIKCRFQQPADLDIVLIQPQPWPGSERWFGPAADEADAGGTRIIRTFAREVELSDTGRILTMRFWCKA